MFREKPTSRDSAAAEIMVPPFADCFKGKRNARHLVSEHLGTKQVVVARLVSLKTFQTGGGGSLTKRVECPKSAFHSQGPNPQFPWLHSPKRGELPSGRRKSTWHSGRFFSAVPARMKLRSRGSRTLHWNRTDSLGRCFSASRSLVHPESLPLGGFHPQAVSPAFLTRIAGQLGWGVCLKGT